MYAYILPSHLSHILNAMLIVSYFFLLYLNLYLLTDSYLLDTTIYNLKQNIILSQAVNSMHIKCE